MAVHYSKYIIGEQDPIEYNIPQVLAIMAPQPHIFLEWARGTGKSTVIAKKAVDFVTELPRSKIALVGATYSQMLTRTLPSTIQGFARLGYYKDKHYFVGRRAPAKWKWKEAYEPILDYTNAIHWFNGTTFVMVSLDMVDGGRGNNVDGAIGDEAALFDYDRLFNNVGATIRGNKDIFGKSPLHENTLYATSVPMTAKGKWLFKMEEEAIKDPASIMYLRADAFHNFKNLGAKWFKENKRVLTKMIYDAEILNIRPGRIEGGFYPQFKEDKHCRDAFNNSFLISLDYNFAKAKAANCLADGDRVHSEPLDIACDYGASFNGVVTCQEVGREFRYLSALHRLSPFNIDTTIQDWCDYYKEHGCKVVNYYYDQSAKGRGHTETFRDMVVRVLTANKWTINEHDIGPIPDHKDRYNFWYLAHQENDSRLPVFRYNESNCKHLILSMNNAGIVEGKNGFEKDKRPERVKKLDQSETTHFSDAHDTLGFAKYAGSLSTSSGDYNLPQ
ncbi:MAG: hypothetical protein A3F72_02965 [Bacteroidetes bacterium RIFCSPLOWO2_12_FULL_35_15]|nr:MAG: hypothetical protein A3F72_02965 [Bacteroidetes bacterium RIFCSPLOWO2_12_FULL_35_15]